MTITKKVSITYRKNLYNAIFLIEKESRTRSMWNGNSGPLLTNLLMSKFLKVHLSRLDQDLLLRLIMQESFNAVYLLK